MKGGTQMIRKVTLRIAVPALLGFMAWNAYLAVIHLNRMQQISTLSLESSAIQTDLSGVLKDFTDLETGQLGYLVTADPAYLQPYNDAHGRITTDLARLRAGLGNRKQSNQSPQSQLESLEKSLQAVMDRSITLRQQGYRHRAFKLVDTNEGKGYMDEVRRIVSSLSTAEGGNFSRFETQRIAARKSALSVTILSNCGLLLLAACLFSLFSRHARLLEEEVTQSSQELAMRDLQLEKLTSALSGQARSNITAINTNSRLLLENYGDFLPRQGHEYAEQMKEAAAQMEQLRQDLIGSPNSGSDEWVAA